jgi:hypothetical protein
VWDHKVAEFWNLPYDEYFCVLQCLPLGSGGGKRGPVELAYVTITTLDDDRSSTEIVYAHVHICSYFMHRTTMQNITMGSDVPDIFDYSRDDWQRIVPSNGSLTVVQYVLQFQLCGVQIRLTI